MKLYAQSVIQHLATQIDPYVKGEERAGKLLYMMPSVPAPIAAQVGGLLSDFCAKHKILTQPLIKIAGALWWEWQASSDSSDREALSVIQKNDWHDDQGNLTRYRNTAPNKPDKTIVVMLMGVDRVTDSSSLADFHQVDVTTIWHQQLKRSFAQWVSAVLDNQNVAYDYNDDTFIGFDKILVPLMNRGLVDIFQISTMLENLDLSGAQIGGDALKVLLGSLGQWGLPLFIRYRSKSPAPFGVYIDAAVSFFNYDAFLEDRDQKKALSTIDKFLEKEKIGDLFDESERGDFGSDEVFVKGVRHYIETRDQKTRKRLLDCDFVTIRDRILKYKPTRGRNENERPPRVKKVRGGPVEVILTALWGTLAEYKKAAAKAGILPHEALSKIHIRGERFKHDCEASGTPSERIEAARFYLSRLMGGIDGFLADWIDPTILCGDTGERKVVSELVRPDIPCPSARTGEPYLEFSISIYANGLKKPITRPYAWRLPEIEHYRVADELIQWAARGIKTDDDYCLPVFLFPYHEELMLAKDDEEVRRVLSHCVRDEEAQIFNLLSADQLDTADPLLRPIQRLAYQYDAFLQLANENGIHKALFSEKWEQLRKTYEAVSDAYLNDPACKESPLAALVFRAFLGVQRRPLADRDQWVWQEYEQSGVVTILHPALLEMLQAHIQYLATCFNTIAGRELQEPGPRAFRPIIWQSYLDLAAIAMPLCGLLKDQDRLLETDVRGDGLVHRIGNAGSAEATLSTRLLLRYDTIEDEDLSDAELFRESRDSVLLFRILKQYHQLHPHVDDGISIVVFQNHEIQPVISAIDRFLNDVWTERAKNDIDPNRWYTLSITFFTESSDDSSVGRFVQQWRERWEAAENQKSLAHYRQTRLSVAHRIVSEAQYYRQFSDLIRDGLEVDIAILCDFIGAGTKGNDFAPVDAYDVRKRTLKFPILERPFCALRDPGRKLQRARVLSNRQFSITTRHSELMARLSRRGAGINDRHVVVGFGDYTPWQGVVDAFHQHAGWVVCIDPNVDQRLISHKGDESGPAREIIGFGSGVGAHGESNYTISTEQLHLADVLQRLKASVGEVYGSWNDKINAMVAKSVLNEVQRLSGLSLVRATGLGEYIRDFMAYALTRKMLRAEGTALCDELVSLDAYQHWFDSSETNTRPDLLWMVARIGEDKRIYLDLRLIECKLAKQVDRYLDKAQQQVENGLRHLVEVFMPRDEENNLEDSRPDQRYWWLQLYRLIASTAEINLRDQPAVLSALERLTEGDYAVSWGAAALTFETDNPSGEMLNPDTWSYYNQGQEMGISVFSCGTTFVQELCDKDLEIQLPWDDRKLRFESASTQAAPGHEADFEKSCGAEKTDDSKEAEPLKTRSSTISKKEIPKENDVQKLAFQKKAPDTEPQGRILLGNSQRGSRKVYWEFGHGDLSNRHLLIFGASGMGKTYAIQCILVELAKAQQNSLIIDYTNGFLPNQIEPEVKTFLNPHQHIIRQSPLPINPFRLQSPDLGGIILPESETTAAKRISSIFQKVYDLGEQQFSVLFDALAEGLKVHGEGMTLEILLDTLTEFLTDETKNKGATQTTLSKIRPFVLDNPFRPAADALDWEGIYADNSTHCHIFQLAGLDLHTWQLTTEFTLWDFYAFLQGKGSKNDPKVIVLDEVQNLDHRDGSPLSKYLREGRKFGVSLILATQILSNLAKDERDRLFNAAHKLFFRPADTEIRTFADIASISTGERPDVWMKQLASLEKGECYSLGPSVNTASGKLEFKPFRIGISPLSERVGANE
jgi:DNA phosphorothioation-dependent restriction protein DptH